MMTIKRSPVSRILGFADPNRQRYREEGDKRRERYRELEQIANECECKCGGLLVVAWGSKEDNFILRCGNGCKPPVPVKVVYTHVGPTGQYIRKVVSDVET